MSSCNTGALSRANSSESLRSFGDLAGSSATTNICERENTPDKTSEFAKDQIGRSDLANNKEIDASIIQKIVLRPKKPSQNKPKSADVNQQGLKDQESQTSDHFDIEITDIGLNDSAPSALNGPANDDFAANSTSEGYVSDSVSDVASSLEVELGEKVIKNKQFNKKCLISCTVAWVALFIILGIVITLSVTSSHHNNEQ